MHTYAHRLLFMLTFVQIWMTSHSTVLSIKAASEGVTVSPFRSIVGMTMYNQATQEIAKPSELLTSVRAYMTVLQSIENYVTIDITRVFNNVLLQQTQHLDSHGEPTITSLYTNW